MMHGQKNFKFCDIVSFIPATSSSVLYPFLFTLFPFVFRWRCIFY